METKYFETHGEGLKLVNEAIEALDIMVTPDTSMNQLHNYTNGIVAYCLDKVLDQIKQRK